ncbi:16S rRNA (cytosine(967)-C(5))-methyltransferase RsmB [Candidatus Solirubrobacter pratensis]|uniref:16S rRNA (cytosine(967)-C(5))-methyltransferase RsmB n=1 Tax=Candidatus Solirubrobacter pratensis TaxID=1298857 RepID=UPI00210135B1|nr:16S rRNA (cytosine(967)-C(5))-methyltransferase RsmB [Candidatus Solirubrobacter pratensis]
MGRGPAPLAEHSNVDAHTQSERRPHVKAGASAVPAQSGEQPRSGTARAVAYAVVRRVFEQDAWADRALHGEARRLRLDARERALATQLAYGTVQRAATLDHVIERLSRRPAAKLDPPVLAALRLGVFQLVFLDRVPPHAAVSESVELAKADAPRGAGLVNAVLRRAAREARRIVAALPDATPEQAALKHSHPEWIARLWFDALGPDQARALMEADNRPAEAVLRPNALRTTATDLAARLPAHVDGEALILDAPFDAFSSPEWEQGLFMPQSRAAMAVARALAPAPGERVLDLCAAPGGKTTHLAELMRNEGEIVAVERHAGRAEALRRTARRMGASIVEVRTGDASQPQEREAYDRVLVDPPCSDLGTLASRPDARWRKAGRPQALQELQSRILAAGAEAVRPGGSLVYSTCTISPAENERVVEAFLASHAEFEASDLTRDVPAWKHPTMPLALQTLPHRDRTDGFFIARLTRR